MTRDDTSDSLTVKDVKAAIEDLETRSLGLDMTRYLVDVSEQIERACPPGYRLVVNALLEPSSFLDDGKLTFEFEPDEDLMTKAMLDGVWSVRDRLPLAGRYWVFIGGMPQVVQVHFDRASRTGNIELMKQVQLWGPLVRP